MATRMQQRRGTASQWTSANPVLNAGEMGWESDTNKFKIGDGTNHWADLDYFADTNSTVVPTFGTSIVFEGATADSYETTFLVTDPTADRTITFPDSTGTVALTSQLPTQYTDENAQDAIGNALGSGLSYDDSTGAISVNTSTIQARVADVSDTEIGYLNGVTSAIQTQIDTKAPLASPTFTGTVTIPAGASISGFATLADPTFTGTVSAANLTLSGDLTVNGTTTNINSTSLVVEDKNIVLGDAESPTDTTADGGGITLKGATDKTFNWVDATDAWTSSEHINLASGKSLYLNGTLLKDVSETLTNKTLSSAVATTALTLNATGELRLADTDSSHYVGFKAPGTVSTNRIWTLPSADGTTGQTLSTDGSGVLQWSTPAQGAAFSELMLIGA